MKKMNDQAILTGTIAICCTIGAVTQLSSLPSAIAENRLLTQTDTQQQNQINKADTLKAIPLDRDLANGFLDIRGVGDSGMALTYQQPLNLNATLPEGGKANFGERLDALDVTGRSYRGDLSFINWETTVGRRCNQFRGKPSRSSYAFMSHPENLITAYQRGFNLIGLANNHSWDCPVGENRAHGALISAQYMDLLSQHLQANWLWHGVGQGRQKTTARVKTLVIKGKPIKVAFASLYLGGACTYITCVSDRDTILRSLRDANADIRILALHSWDRATQQELVKTGKNFILNYRGDVVFGHGPHQWAPVTLVQSASGKKGVIFASLGNFIHPNLSAKRQDMIGRVLFDLQTLKLRQVQAIPLKVDGAFASFKGAPSPTAIPASNLTWRVIDDPNWSNKINPYIRGVYSNIQP